MGDSSTIDTAAQAVLEAIQSSGFSPALAKSRVSAKKLFWSVIARRSGAKLLVHVSNHPTTFASMAHARPLATIALGRLPRGAEVEVLRAASAALELPKGARGIPFIFLAGGANDSAADQRVCGIACAPRIAPIAVFRGHRFNLGDDDNALECIVLGEREVGVFDIDDAKFGTETARHTWSKVKAARMSEKSLTLGLAGGALAWIALDPPPKEELAAALALFKRLELPVPA